MMTCVLRAVARVRKNMVVSFSEIYPRAPTCGTTMTPRMKTTPQLRVQGLGLGSRV